MNHAPLSPLDRALRHLEEIHAGAAGQIQSLREAIAQQRAEGKLDDRDERYIEHELNNILSRAEFNVEDIVRLTRKVMRGAA